MNNLHLKIISFFLLLLSVFIFGCKSELPADAQKIEIVKEKSEEPTKKIAEQYSSPQIAQSSADAAPVFNKVIYQKEDSTDVDQEAKVVSSTEPTQKVVEQPKAQVATKQVAQVAKKKAKARYPEIEFESHMYDFGEIMQGDKIEHKFVFTNTGRAPLTITKADATCGCAAPSIPFMDVMPGEKGYIGILYNSVGKEGEEHPEVTIFSNAKTHPNQVLKLHGFVKVPEKETEKVDTLKSAAIDTTKVGLE